MSDKFSSKLSAWLKAKEPKTLGHLQEAFGDKSFAVSFLLLMSLAALPLPTGGVTHVLEVITALLALELIIGLRTIWLPKWAKEKQLGELVTDKALPKLIRGIRWFERLSRNRLSILFRQSWFLRLSGLLVLVFTITAFMAPPFSGLDTLPGMGVVLIALGWLFEDTAIYAAGIVFGSAGVTLNFALGSAVIHFIT